MTNHYVASPDELRERNNLRGMLYLFAGKFSEINVAGKIPCAEVKPESNVPESRIWHRGSDYRKDVGDEEEYYCYDCGTIWYTAIPKPLA